MNQEHCRRFFQCLCIATIFAMLGYHFYYIIKLPYESSVHAIVHLGFAFTVLLTAQLQKKLSILHGVLLLIALYSSVYFVTHYDIILEDPSYPPMAAMFAGLLACAVAFYLTYEIFGSIFPIITVLGLAYMWKGSVLPAALKAPPIDLERMVTLLAADVTSPWGLYGGLLILSANYLFLFIIFGAVLEAFGGMRFVVSLGTWAAGHFRSGAAALSVISSALLGSVTGSTVANITITGTFTIPLMKKSNYTAEQAAAIETAASCGGQILPPVMGATVFVMSGFTGIPYLSIVKASILSALIYFALLLLYAELNARKRNILPMEKSNINGMDVLFSAPIFVLPLALLLILLFMGFSLMKTIFFCLIAAVVIGLFCNLFSRERLVWREVLDKIVQGALSGSQIAVVLALIGVAVACVEVTGLGMRLGTFLVSLSLNNLHILLVLTALTAIVLGIGLPSPAAYIICATILSPALIKMGVPLLQAHLFPLYYALFSHITPPVGIGLMVACKMAEADYLRSAVEAMKAALPSFVLPFFFVYAPGVLGYGDSLSGIVLENIAIIAFFIAMAAFTNRFFAVRIGMAGLACLLLSGLCLLYFLIQSSNVYFMLAGIGLLVVALAANMRHTKTQETSVWQQ